MLSGHAARMVFTYPRRNVRGRLLLIEIIVSGQTRMQRYAAYEGFY